MSRDGSFDMELSELAVDVEDSRSGNPTLVASSVKENGRAWTMLIDLYKLSIKTVEKDNQLTYLEHKHSRIASYAAQEFFYPAVAPSVDLDESLGQPQLDM